MKKFMVAAFAVAFAAVAQAATINWGSAFATADGGDTLSAGSQAVLIYSATAFTGAATTLDAMAIGGVTDNGGTVVDAYSLNADDLDMWSFDKSYNVAAANANGYYAILMTDGVDPTKASYYDLGQVSGVDEKSGIQWIGVNAGWGDESGDWATSGGFNVAVGNIPEPTSGLLLLIGMAGLALKRKQA